ncbi:MAG: hypothetical protein MK171_11695 [Pirellulales bacterium]|nr:hypothetical protein [Pirellulales bacterium]
MSPSNLEILAFEPSALGLLCLRRRELLAQPGTMVTEVTLNHEFLMSSLTTDSERALAKIALETHPGKNLQVLVGGLGLGYTAREALVARHVTKVEVVELLPPVIDWLARGLIPLATELSDEMRGDPADCVGTQPRLVVAQGDIYARLAGRPGHQWDAILIDVDHSPSERLDTESASFYTVDGLTAARQHLAPDGVLAVWSYAESSPFADALRKVFPQVRVEPITYQNQLVDQTCTDWLFFAKG